MDARTQLQHLIPAAGGTVLASGTMDTGLYEQFVTFSTTVGTVLKLSVMVVAWGGQTSTDVGNVRH